MSKNVHPGFRDFEGFTLAEMEVILNKPFSKASPIEWLTMTHEEYAKIPLLNLIKYMMQIIVSNESIQLTAKGYLPPKFVTDIYAQGYIKDYVIENGISKLKKEADCRIIGLSRMLLESMGLIKKRKSIISLTKKGQSTLNDNPELLNLLINAYTFEFDWGYCDGFEDDGIGQAGFGYSLILLSKYGKKKRNSDFYARKYFKAFPNLIDRSLPPLFGSHEDTAYSAYTIRTFDRFLDYFGLVDTHRTDKITGDVIIKATPFFDKLIKCELKSRFQILSSK